MANPVTFFAFPGGFHSYFIHCNQCEFFGIQKWLIVTWDSDNSISVISSKAKGIKNVEDDRILFNWPKLGEFDGIILETSGVQLMLNTMNR